jgi:GNAT superfamily N-acetyltransferase
MIETIRKAIEARLGSLPFHRPELPTEVVLLKCGIWWIGYGERSRQHGLDTTHCDINIDRDTFYVLSISLAKSLRGQGYGEMFYKALEAVARDIGCRRLVMTPSGKTVRGESRASYLERRGYTLRGMVATKDLNPIPLPDEIKEKRS